MCSKVFFVQNSTLCLIFLILIITAKKDFKEKLVFPKAEHTRVSVCSL